MSAGIPDLAAISPDKLAKLAAISPDKLAKLAAISPDKLAKLGGTALGNAITLCRERAEAGNPPAPFNSSI